MAVYAIGDVQGCYESLQSLLSTIKFDESQDRLWLTGDLVNRGPQSVEVLRFVSSLGDRAISVLGNHDLHLLAVATGAQSLGPRDTFFDVLAAPDRDQLIDWLARRPLFHYDSQLGYALVHAGLVPAWDLNLARAYTAEIETVLQKKSARADFFAHMYGDMPEYWKPSLNGYERLRFIVNVCTRLRYCAPDGRVDLSHKGPPGTQPPPLIPWFQAPGRLSHAIRIVFGHWSTLGLWNDCGVIGLDTGCLWGRRLTAVRLSSAMPEFFSVSCLQQQIPHGL